MADERTMAHPVEDSVPQVDNAVAVGEDLAFQHRWWRFEKGIWIFFGLILLADALGVFGRGLLAKAERRAADGTMWVKYERVERANTPSIMTIHFDPSAVHNGTVRLFVSESVVKQLGAQRVIPQPQSSTLSADGVTYSFLTSGGASTVEIALEPSFAGVQDFRVQVEGAAAVRGRVAVVP